MYKDLVLATTTDEFLEAAEAEILDVGVLLDAVPAALTAQPTLLNGNIIKVFIIQYFPHSVQNFGISLLV
jgi:hypothetical protein